MKTIKDADVTGKKVLVRCDFNVPLDENGNILDNFRIKETAPTINYLADKGARVILMSHLGDPEGFSVNLTLDKVKESLSQILGREIKKANDCTGEEVKKMTQSLLDGEILILENLRFNKEEAENNQEFAKQLAGLADIYINEAFSVCHREHASIASVPFYLPAYAGFLLEKEIVSLERVYKDPEKPMIAIIGGKKVETKIKVIDRLSERSTFVIISGLIKKEADEKKIPFILPEKIVAPTGNLSDFDISDETIELFKEKILTAKTVLWNGPFGKTEDEQYCKGTLAIANAIVESGAFSLAGGGETIEFLDRHGLTEKFSHVSTGGGAMLSFLAGEELPGLKALN